MISLNSYLTPMTKVMFANDADPNEKLLSRAALFANESVGIAAKLSLQTNNYDTRISSFNVLLN